MRSAHGKEPVMARLWSLTVLALMGLLAGTAGAQDLNQRTDAPPGSKATIGRLMTKTQLMAAEQGKTLVREDIVNTDCGPVRIGNVDDEQRDGLRPRENVTLVQGNVVNLCR